MLFNFGKKIKTFGGILQNAQPNAIARLTGDDRHPKLSGTVYFYKAGNGILVAAEVFGLPSNQSSCSGGIFAFHLHEGENCTGTPQDSFADAKMHYNPNGCDHPYHAGDFPPLFENRGYAWLAFYTERFSLSEVIGRTVIIHDQPDDFHTQPAGNSGRKIACGTVVRR
jgi:Cu-Zn family superoxide dismutase